MVILLRQITRGSKEEILIDITDRRGLVTDLSTAGPKQDVRLGDNSAYKQTSDGTYANAVVASASGLTVIATVDTLVGGIWAAGAYKLYVWFVVGTQTVRKGPYLFEVVE